MTVYDVLTIGGGLAGWWVAKAALKVTHAILLAACAFALPEMFASSCMADVLLPKPVESKPGYNAWPMIQSAGGRLICTYSRGSGHSIGEGRRDAFARVSTDGGKTWGAETVVAANPDEGEVMIGKGLDSRGAALFWVRCIGKGRHHDLYRTEDGVGFERISSPKLDPMPMQITDVFAVKKGLMCLWFATSYSKDGRSSWGTLFSADDGATWTQKTVESDLPLAELPTEPSVAVLGGGRLLCIARTEVPGEKGGRQFQLTSVDDGDTWRKERTNIGDIRISTPSLVYDGKSGLVCNYYYERGKGRVKRRTAGAELIFTRPLEWPEPEVVAYGKEERPHDAGNVNVAVVGDTHFLAYYFGTRKNAAVYVVPVPSPAYADVVVYGSSPAAVTAAVKASDMGLKPVIVSPETHVGGLSVSGLGYTDSGNTAAIGGLAREFYHRIYLEYQKPETWRWQRMEDFKADGQGTRAIRHDDRTMWTFEPHVAERVFSEWLAEKGVDVRRDEFLDRENGVARSEGRITSIRTLSGRTYLGKYFVDATYEGDLMAAAGVPYRVGREDCSEFGEKWNGNQVGVLHHRHHFRDWRISAYKTPGDPSSGFCAEVDGSEPGKRGTGDRRVQAYCYRLCMTDDPRNRIPFAKPEGYDPSRYALLARVYEKGYCETFAKFDRIANHKTDTNNHGPFNADFIGASYEWPEAGYARRAELAKAHRDYQMGLYYFIANDPSVPGEVREAMSKWGLAKDEFADNGGWPYYVYVREGRRMSGEYVMTEHDCLGEARHSAQGRAYGPVGMGSYALDSHNVRRYVTPDGYVQNEGDIGVHPKRPYGIDYGAIVPRRADCRNLLVPVALSATHTAFGSIRMEPVFMILGESAATAAAIAAKDGIAVQDVPYAALRRRLLADGQVLE